MLGMLLHYELLVLVEQCTLLSPVLALMQLHSRAQCSPLMVQPQPWREVLYRGMCLSHA